MIIDYVLLAQAVTKYKYLGYQFVEVPWMVTPQTSQITKPPGAEGFILTDGKHLIGSAEQGFIQASASFKYNRKLASISPCFRKNDNRDYYHQETFMKLELFIQTIKKPWDKVYKLINDASQVFEELGIKKVYFNQTSESNLDIEAITKYGNLELGSYGYRHVGETYFIYGTGLALPRFQMALEEQDNEL